MKIFGKYLVFLVAVLVLLVLALVLFLRTVNVDRLRPWIMQKASAASGRTVILGGPLSLAWVRPANATGWDAWIPRPVLTARAVQVSNPAWARREQFATIDSVTLSAEVLPLFARQIIITRIALNHPVIDIERAADLQTTWRFKPADHKPSAWQVQLRELAFADGLVTVTDVPTRIELRATVTTIGAPIALGQILDHAATRTAPAVPPVPVPLPVPQAGNPYGFDIRLEGTYRDAPVRGSAKIGGVLSLMDAHRPFPIEADVHLGDNHLLLRGTLTDPARLAALDMHLTLGANSMADLYDLTGVTLPDTPVFRTSGHLTGRLDTRGNTFKYDQFTGTVGSSDLSGTLEFSSGAPRPSLRGTVRSKRLALADLGPAIGGAPARHGTAPHRTRRRPGQDPAKALPDVPFRTHRWQKMDADVVFTGDTILRSAALPVTAMHTHLRMDNGQLTLDPLQFGVAGGTMTGTIRLNGRHAPMEGNIDIAARHLQIKQMFPTFQPMKTSFGEINGDARLALLGNSTASLASAANGEIKLLISNGAISSTLLEEAGLNVANIVAAKLFGDKTVDINCAAADFVVRHGVLDARVFAFDTTDALINVNGNINLGTEQMMLDVYPHTKGFRVFSLRSPLYVKGTFKKPDIGVMKGPLAMRGAAAVALGVINPFAALLALLAPSNNQASPCPAMLATARAGLQNAPALRQ